MKKFKVFLAVLISILQLFLVLPLGVFGSVASAEEVGRICFSNVAGGTGDVVKFPISLVDNPGIVSLRLKVEFDETKLALNAINADNLLSSADEFGSLHQDEMKSPFTLFWSNPKASENFAEDGTLIELFFEILPGVDLGEEIPVKVICNRNDRDALNKDGQVVNISIDPGAAVTVVRSLPTHFRGEQTAYEQIKLSWDGVEGCSGYYIYRSDSAGINGQRIASVPADRLNFIDNNVQIGKTYYYTIKTVDENQEYNSQTSDPIGVTCRHPSVKYRTHCQSYGNLPWVSNGASSGTTGEAKRLEAVYIELFDVMNGCLGDIEYRVHAQSYGWMPWVKNGKLSGTAGEAKRLEAIQIRLTGELAEKYDVYYCVHAQSEGWLNWAKNGEASGTAGKSKRLESLKILILPKGAQIPNKLGTKSQAYVCASRIEYATHVQSFGWQKASVDGAASGTVGSSKRLEGIKIKLSNNEYSGGILYQTHIQSYGWETEWKSDEQMSGTSGEAKRLEAIRIKLYGEMANHYDVYYCVHSQTYGWLDWAKNGQESGTSGEAKRLEAIRILIVPKGEKAPGKTDYPFVKDGVKVSADFVF